MFTILAILALQEEKGTYLGPGEETWRMEVVEDRLVCFSTLRKGDARADAVLTLSKKDFKPLLYAVVRGKDELRLEWKGAKVRCEIRAGGKESVREVAVPADAAWIDEAHPSQFLTLLRRFKPGKHKAFSAASLTVVDLVIEDSRVTIGSTVVEYDAGRIGEWHLVRRPKKEGKVPAIVIVSDDDAFASALANRFAAEGIATAVSRDPAAAVACLRKECDAIAILGHGDAGVVVPAAADAKIRGLILISVPSKPLEEAILERMKSELGATDEMLEEQRKQLREIRDSKEDWIEIDGRKTFIRPLRERLRQDPGKAVRAFAGPVVAIQTPDDPDGWDAKVTVARFDELDPKDEALLKFLAESALRILK